MKICALCCNTAPGTQHAIQMCDALWRNTLRLSDGAKILPAKTPQQRLAFHRRHSGPVAEKLCGRPDAQLTHKKTGPNSGLGKAITWGDLFMSLIHTCELGGANPFDYLPNFSGMPGSWRIIHRRGCLELDRRKPLACG